MYWELKNQEVGLTIQINWLAVDEELNLPNG
jgi:hypothetical protein